MIQFCIRVSSPEVPQAAFARGQLCQGRENLLENELPVLLVPIEHLRKSYVQSTKSKHNNTDNL